MNSKPVVLLKTASEISIKSEFVQSRFSSILVRNIKACLKNGSVPFSMVSMGRGRIFVDSEAPVQAIESLKRVFGIHELAIASKVEDGSFESAVVLAVEIAKSVLKTGDSFCVRCSRSGNQAFSSKDIEIEAGTRILESINGLKVKLVNPSATIFIEVAPRYVIGFSKTVKGLDGLPVNTQGTVGLLLEGSQERVFETGVLLLKRGCGLVAIGSKMDYQKPIEELELFNSGNRIAVISEDSLTQKKIVALASSKSVFETESVRFSLPVLCPLEFFPSELLPKVAV